MGLNVGDQCLNQYSLPLLVQFFCKTYLIAINATFWSHKSERSVSSKSATSWNLWGDGLNLILSPYEIHNETAQWLMISPVNLKSLERQQLYDNLSFKFKDLGSLEWQDQALIAWQLNLFIFFLCSSSSSTPHCYSQRTMSLEDNLSRYRPQTSLQQSHKIQCHRYSPCLLLCSLIWSSDQCSGIVYLSTL